MRVFAGQARHAQSELLDQGAYSKIHPNEFKEHTTSFTSHHAILTSQEVPPGLIQIAQIKNKCIVLLYSMQKSLL